MEWRITVLEYGSQGWPSLYSERDVNVRLKLRPNLSFINTAFPDADKAADFCLLQVKDAYYIKMK